MRLSSERLTWYVSLRRRPRQLSQPRVLAEESEAAFLTCFMLLFHVFFFASFAWVCCSWFHTIVPARVGFPLRPLPVSHQVLARLRAAPLPSIETQYLNWLQLSTLTTLVGETSRTIHKIDAVAAQNLLSPFSTVKPQLLVSYGPAGCGKTRTGYEVLLRAQRLSRAQSASAAHRLHFVPFYLDLGNGSGSRDLDNGSASECIGARLAARALCVLLEDVHTLNGGKLTGLTVTRVMSAIVARVLDREEASAGDVVLIGLHIDEYQLFVDENDQPMVDFLKAMLSEVTNFVKNAELHKQLGVSLAIVPVVTGTPYRGPDILWTKWLTPVALPVPSMDSDGALHLVADVMQRTEAFASWRDEVLAALASSKEAEYVMMSTG